jgi:predicted amidophosphoribosyltransferase
VTAIEKQHDIPRHPTHRIIICLSCGAQYRDVTGENLWLCDRCIARIARVHLRHLARRIIHPRLHHMLGLR